MAHNPQAVSCATQANVLSGEPTSTGSYARIAILNNATNFPNASVAFPSVMTADGSFSFSVSTAAWPSGSTKPRACANRARLSSSRKCPTS
jgi:hypothetical protein